MSYRRRHFLRSMFSPWRRGMAIMKAHHMHAFQVQKPVEVPVVDNFYPFLSKYLNSCDPVHFLRRAKCKKVG